MPVIRVGGVHGLHLANPDQQLPQVQPDGHGVVLGDPEADVVSPRGELQSLDDPNFLSHLPLQSSPQYPNDEMYQKQQQQQQPQQPQQPQQQQQQEPIRAVLYGSKKSTQPTPPSGVDDPDMISFVSDWQMRVAQTYISDACKGRPPHIRIQHTDKFIFGRGSPLTLYNFIHHRYWRWFMSFIISVQLLLGFFEHNKQYQMWCTIVEVFIIIISLIDVSIRLYCHDNHPHKGLQSVYQESLLQQQQREEEQMRQQFLQQASPNHNNNNNNNNIFNNKCQHPHLNDPLLLQRHTSSSMSSATIGGLSTTPSIAPTHTTTKPPLPHATPSIARVTSPHKSKIAPTPSLFQQQHHNTTSTTTYYNTNNNNSTHNNPHHRDPHQAMSFQEFSKNAQFHTQLLQSHPDYHKYDTGELTNSDHIALRQLPSIEKPMKTRNPIKKRFPSFTWARVRVALLLLTSLDIFLTVVFGFQIGKFYRITRLARPYFFLEKGRVLRQLVTAVVRTIPSILEVVVLIALTITTFSLAGFFLYSKKGLDIGSNEFFSTIENSMFSMTVLMTTANFPDVMMASYTASNPVALFFVVFLLIALYLLFNVILSAVYARFQLEAYRLLHTIPLTQLYALTSAFELLARPSEMAVLPTSMVSPDLLEMEYDQQQFQNDKDSDSEDGGAASPQQQTHQYKTSQHNVVNNNSSQTNAAINAPTPQNALSQSSGETTSSYHGVPTATTIPASLHQGKSNVSLQSLHAAPENAYSHRTATLAGTIPRSNTRRIVENHYFKQHPAQQQSEQDALGYTPTNNNNNNNNNNNSDSLDALQVEHNGQSMPFTAYKKRSWLYLMNLGYTQHSDVNNFSAYKTYLQLHYPEEYKKMFQNGGSSGGTPQSAQTNEQQQQHDQCQNGDNNNNKNNNNNNNNNNNTPLTTAPFDCSHQDVISQDTFLRLLQQMRPDLTLQQQVLLFEALDQQQHHHIHIHEWFAFADFVDVKFINNEYKTKKQQLRIAAHNIPQQYPRVLKWIGGVIASSWFGVVIDVLSVVHFFALLLQLEQNIPDGTTPDNGGVTWNVIVDYFNVTLTIFYTIEFFFRILIFGFQRCYKSLLMSYEMILLVITYVIYGMLYFDLAQDWISGSITLTSADLLAFRALRVYRHLYKFPRFRAILLTLKKLYPALRSLFVILISEYYFFGMLGVCLFKDVIIKGRMDDEFLATYWAQNNYWENNFNDLYHAYIVLFEIMIINNWNLNIEGWTVALHSHWPRVYFVCHFFLAIIIILNCVIALVLDAFISKYSVQSHNEEEKERAQIQNNLKQHQNTNNLHYNDEYESTNGGGLDGKNNTKSPPKPMTLKQLQKTEERKKREQNNNNTPTDGPRRSVASRRDRYPNSTTNNDLTGHLLESNRSRYDDDVEYYSKDESLNDTDAFATSSQCGDDYVMLDEDAQYQPYMMSDSDSSDDEGQQLVLTLIKRADHEGTINTSASALHSMSSFGRNQQQPTVNPENQQRIVFKKRTQKMYQMIFDK